MDYLIRQSHSGEEEQELDTLLKQWGVTYLAVDPAETAGFLFERYQTVYQGKNLIILNSGYQTEAITPQPAYWDKWRIAGALLSMFFTCAAVGFKLWSDKEEQLEREEMLQQVGASG